MMLSTPGRHLWVGPPWSDQRCRKCYIPREWRYGEVDWLDETPCPDRPEPIILDLRGALTCH